MKLFHGSIRKKLIILVLLATTPVFIVLLATEWVNRQNAVLEAEKEAATFLNGFAEVQRRVTGSTRILLRTVASMPEIREGNAERSHVILSTLLETNPIYTNVILVDIKGNVVSAGRNHDKAKKLNFSDRKQFRDAIVSKGFASGEFVLGKSSRKSIFPFGMAVLNEDGAPNGVIIVGVDLNHYGRLYERGEYPRDTFFGLCDRNGLRLFRYPVLDKIEIGKPIKNTVFQAASNTVGEGSVMATTSDGLKHILVFEPIGLGSGEAPYMYMFMGCNYEQILEKGDSILYRMIFSALFSLIIALAIAWFVGGRRIALSVEQLTRRTQVFARGEENVTSDIDYGDGEVGDLARSFDNMVTLLRQREDERRQAEKALQISHERFLSVLDGIDATVYVADMETYEVLFMNKFMIKTFGRDLTGAKCWSAFRNETGPCEYCTNDQIVDENGRLSDAVIWQDKNPVTNRFYVNHDRAIEWTDGRLVRLQMATDITDMKRIEAELLQTQKMESIGTLAGGIAHDFNNILFPIMGHTEILLDDIPHNSPLRDSLNEIYLSSLRAKDLVNQILTFSRQEKAEFNLIKISPIIKEALKLIRSTIPKSIDITEHIEDGDGLIKADPTQIHQIIMNLATNAYHAMEDTGGGMLVRLTEVELGKYDLMNPGMVPGAFVCLTIEDKGIGIDKKLEDKIFEPFFTTKEKGKGTGMGLAVVHGIVTRMNGGIQIVSNPGKGTKFLIYFPMEKSSRELEARANHSIQGGDEHILLVDDEDGIIKMEEKMLERLGYKVSSYTDSIEALDQFHTKPETFDLVITDFAMPKMSGDELAFKLLDIRPDIPIILNTGFSDKMTPEIAEAIGIKDILMKPIIKAELAQTIRTVLGERES